MTLIYRYSVDELKLMNEQLSRHLNSYNQWAAKVNNALSKVKKHQTEGNLTEVKVKIEDLTELLEFADANKFSTASPEYVQLKQILNEAQIYAKTAKDMIKLFRETAPFVLEEEIENIDEPKPKVKCSSCLEREEKFSLEEIQKLTSKINEFSFAVPEAKEINLIHSCVFEIEEKILGITKKSLPVPKAAEVQKLVAKAKFLYKIIEFSSSLNQLEHRYAEIAWLEKYESLFRQNPAVSLSSVDELLVLGLKLPTTSASITKKIANLQLIKDVAKKWIEKVDCALINREIDWANDDYFNDNDHLPSLEFLEALLTWCDANQLLRTVDYSIDLSPQYDRLVQATEACKVWNKKADELMTTIQKVNSATAPDKLPLLSTIESFVDEAKMVQCRLERQTFFINIVTAANSWIENLVSMFEFSETKLYRAFEVLLPRQLSPSILTTYTSRGTFLHLSRKVTFDRKEHPFLQMAKAEGIRSAAMQRRYLEYGIVERETILILRAKHKIRRRLVESITLDEVEDRPQLVATTQPPRTSKKKTEQGVLNIDGDDESSNSSSSKDVASGSKEVISITEVLGNNKLCFCGKDFEDYLLECYLCRDWFHRSCIDYVSKNNSTSNATPSTCPNLISNRRTKSIKTNKDPEDGDEKDWEKDIGRQELYLCCLCLRGKRPRVKDIDAHHSNLKRLSAQFVEAEIFRCYRERVHVWLAKTKQELRQHPKIQVLFNRVARTKGDTRTILPEGMKVHLFENFF